MNKVKKLNKDKKWHYLAIANIIIFYTFMLIISVATDSFPIGESDDYMLATVSLQEHGSLDIRPTDLERAKIDYPDHRDYLEASYSHSLPTTESGIKFPWYFGTYSFLCIPVKLVFQVFNINQALSFAVTNVILYTLALLSVLFILRKSSILKFFLILLLTISPACLYLYWPSAEVMIYSFIIISLVFWENKNRYLSALFLSIAATMNSTIMMIGVFYLIDFGLEFFYEYKSSGKLLIEYVKNKFPEVIRLGICFFPCLLPLIHNFVYFGTMNLQMKIGSFVDNGNIINRFMAYLFDLNFGVFPYYPILFVLFLFLSALCFLKGRRGAIMYFGSFFSTVFLYSVMAHINCGMTGIARYNVWVLPLIIFFVSCYGFDFSCTKKRKISFFCTLFLSISLTGFVLLYNFNTDFWGGYVNMSKLTSVVLDYAPQMYNPYPYTFLSRVEHVDGGYSYTAPVIYANKEGQVRKIMFTQETMPQVFEMVIGDETAMSYLSTELKSATKVSNGFYYANIDKKYWISKKSV